ncbi:UDP-N-acetylmuramate dehydrogenase [Anaerolentibacter hominis]|uniref:UDP-N-acetylmuramate dehydrogenase n=1 Tax=Anaerolentibacter hominis TaxID=3079009 RepID=UPI0031B88B50
MIDPLFLTELRKIVEDNRILTNEPLKNHTTFRIGGPADYFVCPSTTEEIRKVLMLTATYEVPCYILGNGSNVLFSDKGYPGVVLHIGEPLDYLMMIDGPEDRVTVRAGAGILLRRMARKVAEAGLKGFEFAGGIPGSLGGAVLMNAGAYGGEMKDHIVDVYAINDACEYEALKKNEMHYGYRTSIMQEQTYIILGATFEFEKGNPEEILAYMEELNRRRKEKQPLEYASAGSAFKRPEGYYAGKLICDAGLKGYRVGDIMVSEKHAGFIVNVGNGTAEQVCELMMHVQDTVKEKFGVLLEPEIRIIGELE